MTPQERKPLSRREFALLCLEQNGKCANCGAKLDLARPRMTVDEHLVPLFSGGPNELSNRAIWCVDCAKAKTAGEAPGRAKVRRFEQKKTQADKRKAAGGSRIQSPGFDKRFKKKMNGKVVAR